METVGVTAVEAMEEETEEVKVVVEGSDFSEEKSGELESVKE